MYDRRPGFMRNDDPPSGRRVDATVKWFNASKGFGFVTPSDGSQDAFLPMATLRRAGFDDVREGTTLVCEIGAGAKGPLVVTVLNVDNSTAVEGGGGFSVGSDRRDRDSGRLAATSVIEGAVKWFSQEKGFGFISPDGGGKDVFVHISVLGRSGVSALDSGMRVRVRIAEGKKGMEADKVELL